MRSQPLHWMRQAAKLHAPVALPLRRMGPGTQLDRRPGEPRSQAGHSESNFFEFLSEHWLP
jgi:hypothetical protein